MSGALWVLAGSALGGLARYGVSIWIVALTGPRLPWATLAINILGSFVIGLFGAATTVEGRLVVAPEMRLFVMVGLCGGFTTFSSFSLQTLELLQSGEFGWAAAYIAGSVALCLIGVWAGFAIGRI